jgi:hypothetical protein
VTLSLVWLTSVWLTSSMGGPIVDEATGTTRQALPSEPMPHSVRSGLIPTDGSIVRAEHHVSIYCAPCARWIDCRDGIPPETALERHAALVH